jgi:hypothetical protein
LLWGAREIGSSTAVRWLFPGFSFDLSELNEIQIRATRAGTLRNLRVRHRTLGGGAQTITYTLFVNGVASALTCTLTSNVDNNGQDLVNSVAIAADDLLSIKITKSAVLTGGEPVDVTATVEYA